MRIRACAVMVVLTWCNVATADIQDGLDSMFMTTGNEPSIYQSQRRLGVDFGTLRLRAPITTYQLVNLTPPNLRAGCGGIDLYGGSFTFINAEQFRQLLRQIGANALGYAFKLALASMCKECDSILTGLQDTVSALNEMQVDTCKWAKGFVNDIADGVPERFRENWKLEETTAGNFTDTFGAVQSLFDNWGDAEAGADPDGADPNQSDEVGNYTWNALVRRGQAGPTAGSTFAFLAGNVNHDELLMNIAGTFLYGMPAGSELSGPVERRLTYHEFKFGKTLNAADTENTSPLLICQGTRDKNDACLIPDAVSLWSFPGVQVWADGKLQEAADHMANPATMGQEHAVPLQEFIGTLPFTVMRHMMELQGDQSSLNQYVQAIKEYVGAVYASTLAIAMAEKIEAAYDDGAAPQKFPHVDAAIKTFREDAEQDRQAVEGRYMEELIRVETLVKELTKRDHEEASPIKDKN